MEMDPVRDEQEIGSRGRFLEILQECVRRIDVEGLRGMDHDDLRCAAVTRYVDEARKVADLLDHDTRPRLARCRLVLSSVRRRGLNQSKVGMSSRGEPPAGVTSPAALCGGFAQERLGEREHKTQLSNAFAAVHEQRMRKLSALSKKTLEARLVPR